MTSSNGTIFRVTGPLCWEFTGTGEIPAQWPMTRSFDVFFDLRLNKRLSKQPWGLWFETPLWSLWRQCNDRLILTAIYRMVIYSRCRKHHWVPFHKHESTVIGLFKNVILIQVRSKVTLSPIFFKNARVGKNFKKYVLQTAAGSSYSQDKHPSILIT